MSDDVLSEDARTLNLDADLFHDLAKSTKRRRVITHLVENGETHLSDLAETLAAAANDEPRDALGTQERKRMYVSLYQVHLPKMDNVDVLEFDKDSGVVAPTEETTRFGAVLDAIEPAFS